MKLTLPIQTLQITDAKVNEIPIIAFKELKARLGEEYDTGTWNAGEQSAMNRIHGYISSSQFLNDPDWQIFNHPDTGSWVKRLSSYMYKNYKQKISDKLAGILGDTVGKYASSDPITYFFEIDKYVNWTPGAFREKTNSCWWSNFNSCRLGWETLDNAYALLFYESMNHYKAHRRKDGIGRSWLMHRDDHALIFNGYGLPLSTQASILSQTLNTSFRRGSLTSDGAYINAGNCNNEDGQAGGLAYFIGDKDALEQLKMPQDIGDIRLKDCTCYDCNKPMHSGACKKINGHFVCPLCRSTNYITCGACGKIKSIKNFGTAHSPNTSDSMSVCEQCFMRLETCINHGKVIGTVWTVWHTKRTYCNTCISDERVCRCSICSRIQDTFTVYRAPKGSIINVCRTCKKTWKGKEVKYEKRTIEPRTNENYQFSGH